MITIIVKHHNCSYIVKSDDVKFTWVFRSATVTLNFNFECYTGIAVVMHKNLKRDVSDRGNCNLERWMKLTWHGSYFSCGFCAVLMQLHIVIDW